MLMKVYIVHIILAPSLMTKGVATHTIFPRNHMFRKSFILIITEKSVSEPAKKTLEIMEQPTLEFITKIGMDSTVK